MKLYEPFQFLTEEECDQLLEYGRSSPKQTGKTLGKSALRKNRIVWYRESKWWPKWLMMFQKMDESIEWIQDPQISFYIPGERYDWHVDTTPKHRTHIRHFTLTCELQTAKNARFELENYSLPKLKKGQAIIFKPSDMHRATSPTFGERVSFTIWAMSKNLTKS